MQSTFPVNVKAMNHTKASKDNPVTAARVRISAGKETTLKNTREKYIMLQTNHLKKHLEFHLLKE